MFGPSERGTGDETREGEIEVPDRSGRITDFDAGRRQREARRIVGTEATGARYPMDVVRAMVAAQERSGLTTSEMAERLGVTRNTVSLIRNGKMRVTLLLVIRWLGACGWDLMAVER